MIAAAALRPSAMAQTTSDWPRRMSPAAKIPGTELAVVPFRGDVAARIELDAELLNHSAFDRSGETQGQENKIGFNHDFGARNRLEFGRRTNSNPVKFFYVAIVVAHKFGGVEGPIAEAALLVGAFGAQLKGPERPGRARMALLGRHRHDLKLADGRSLLAVASAQTVGAGVAAADDHNALAGGENLAGDFIAGDPLVLLRQELHREVDALEFAARDFQIAGSFGATGEQNRVKFLAKVVHRHVVADVRVGLKLNAFDSHLFEAAIKDELLHLEIWNAVAQKPADPIGFLENGNPMAGAVQLLRGGETRRTRTDDGDALCRCGLRAAPA